MGLSSDPIGCAEAGAHGDARARGREPPGRRSARARRAPRRARSGARTGWSARWRSRRRTSCGRAGPTTITSAPRATASSTRAAPTSRAWRSVVSSRQPRLVGHGLGQVEDRRGRLVVAGDVLVQVVRPVDLDDVHAGQGALGLAGKLAGDAHHERVGGAAVEADDDASRGDLGQRTSAGTIPPPTRGPRTPRSSAGPSGGVRRRPRPCGGWLAAHRTRVGRAPS